MTAPMTPKRVEGIRARAEAATPGPWCTDSWEIYQGTEYVPGVSLWIGETCRGTGSPEQDRADAEFVAHAREDVPALLAEVQRLKAALSDATNQVSELGRGLGVAALEAALTAKPRATDGAVAAAICAACDNDWVSCAATHCPNAERYTKATERGWVHGHMDTWLCPEHAAAIRAACGHGAVDRCEDCRRCTCHVCTTHKVCPCVCDCPTGGEGQ